MSKKLLSLLLAFAMVLGFSAGALAGTDTALTTAAPAGGDIVILHTNDVHGAIGGYAKIAALKAKYEAAGAYVLLMDAGDFSQGTTSVSLSKGANGVELMNLAGYDVATLGNHEFDYGYEQLKTNLTSAKFATVAANVLYNGSAAFKSNTVFTSPSGLKIGVFGLATPETATKANPKMIVGVTFADIVETAKAQVAALEAEKCDLIVCLGHLGVDDESTGHRSTDLLAAVTGIDLFIDGHSHSVIDGNKNDYATGDTMLVSTGTAFANIGVVTYSSGKLSASLVPVTADLEADATVKARADEITAAIDAEYGVVFAQTEVELTGSKAPGNRTMETNLGDLITDAMVWQCVESGITVDAAVTNGGGIRAAVKTGGITKKDINTVLPFGNTLAIVRVTGAELLEALEASTFCTPTAAGGFPQVSGIVFTVDTTVDFDAGEHFPGTTVSMPNSIKRVTIKSVGGKAFDEKAVYSIATNNFTASGGDTYYVFAKASSNVDTGFVLDEVVMDYIVKALNGVVTEADYGKTEGRITVIYKASYIFSDLAETQWYYPAVNACYHDGLVKGNTATTYNPNGNITVAEYLTMLYRLGNKFGMNYPEKATTGANWTEAASFMANDALSAAQLGKTVSRQEMAYYTVTFLNDVAEATGKELVLDTTRTAFTDANAIGPVFCPFVNTLYAAGGIGGDPTGAYRPADLISRAEIAQVIYNLSNTVSFAVPTAAAAD